jgi:polysaccharide pyruvyl transferase WcaK-like protein
VVTDPREDAVDVLDHIERCDVVVAARYHTALLSLGVGCPTVGVAYSRKTFDLFELLDLETMVIALEAVTGRDLIAAVETAMRDERSPAAAERRSEVRREVVAQFDELFGAVPSGG